jgi:hypothetical protein
MQDIFSNKTKQIAALTEAMQNVQGQIESLKESKNVSEEFTKLRSDFDSMKLEWTNKVSALETQVASLQKEKAEIEAKAVIEVAKAQTELTEQVNEGVAVKFASMGLPEEKLPTVPAQDNLPKVDKTVQQNPLFEQWSNASIFEKQEIFNKNKTEWLKAAGISQDLWDTTFNK